jgi:hypothetical protein
MKRVTWGWFPTGNGLPPEALEYGTEKTISRKRGKREKLGVIARVFLPFSVFLVLPRFRDHYSGDRDKTLYILIRKGPTLTCSAGKIQRLMIRFAERSRLPGSPKL